MLIKLRKQLTIVLDKYSFTKFNDLKMLTEHDNSWFFIINPF